MSKVLVSYNKKKHCYTYRGDLKECRDYAVKRLNELNKNREFEFRYFSIAKNRYDRFMSKIDTYSGFISVADRKLSENDFKE